MVFRFFRAFGLCFGISFLLAYSVLASDFVQFVSTAIRKYQQVGAVAPFSRYTAQAMVDEIEKYTKRQVPEAKTIKLLEVGAGNGALTKYFVKFLLEKKISFQLDLVELDTEFSEILIKKFKKYPQITIYNNDICAFDTHKKYDIIISTLPFNCKDFSPSIVKSIMDKLESVSNDKGLFLSVEYIAMGPIGYYVFWDSLKKEDYTQKHLILHEFREKHDTYTKKVLLNMPPTYIYVTCIDKKYKI